MKELKNMRKSEVKGITLVALVVTIVVLIILATISINIIFGEEGILERAKQAKQDYANAEVEEQQMLADTANSIDKYIVGERESDKIVIDENERIVGTFYGKTLYQKTFTGTTPNSTVATLVDISDLNIDICTKIEGVVHCEAPSSKGYVPFGYGHGSDTVALWYNETTKVLQIRAGQSIYLNQTYYVTIQYTKVTE